MFKAAVVTVSPQWWDLSSFTNCHQKLPDPGHQYFFISLILKHCSNWKHILRFVKPAWAENSMPGIWDYYIAIAKSAIVTVSIDIYMRFPWNPSLSTFVSSTQYTLIYHRFDAFLCDISSRKILWHNKYQIHICQVSWLHGDCSDLNTHLKHIVTACFFKTRGSESCHYHKVVQADLAIHVTVYRRSNASVSISYCSLTRIPRIVHKLTWTEFIIILMKHYLDEYSSEKFMIKGWVFGKYWSCFQQYRYTLQVFEVSSFAASSDIG